jgi:hypothetical protein
MNESTWLRLYPRAWRARYGDELAALLEARSPSLIDRLDLIRGAFDAHLHPELIAAEPRAAGPFDAIPPADLKVARRLGLASIVGAVAWVAAWVVAANGPVVYDVDGSYRDGAAAAPIILLAGALLVGGIIGHLIVLPPGARFGRIGAIVAIGGVLIWSLAPWLLWAAAAWIVGLAALAVSGWRARVWPTWAGLVLIVVELAVASFIWLALAAGRGRGTDLPELVAAVTLMTTAWLVVGATLVRVPQPAIERA